MYILTAITHNFLSSPVFMCKGRLKLTVLSEDRLQMKWKEADGPVQGYKVRVRSISGETFRVVFKCPHTRGTTFVFQ